MWFFYKIHFCWSGFVWEYNLETQKLDARSHIIVKYSHIIRSYANLSYSFVKWANWISFKSSKQVVKEHQWKYGNYLQIRLKYININLHFTSINSIFNSFLYNYINYQKYPFVSAAIPKSYTGYPYRDNIKGGSDFNSTLLSSCSSRRVEIHGVARLGRFDSLIQWPHRD